MHSIFLCAYSQLSVTIVLPSQYNCDMKGLYDAIYSTRGERKQINSLTIYERFKHWDSEKNLTKIMIRRKRSKNLRWSDQNWKILEICIGFDLFNVQPPSQHWELNWIEISSNYVCLLTNITFYNFAVYTISQHKEFRNLSFYSVPAV